MNWEEEKVEERERDNDESFLQKPTDFSLISEKNGKRKRVKKGERLKDIESNEGRIKGEAERKK